MSVRILQGDCREVLRTLPDNSVDAIVTDPPYHLTTGKKGGTGAASVNADSPAGRAMIGTGFMGMAWDGGDVAFQPATWAEALRVLKPGGYLLAFGGTRTYHRLACAIEDGGFEVRDMLAWLYGSGFPKGTDKAKIPEAWKGWNTALKPAIEPVCMGRKPMDGTLAQNLQRWGTGALWIDGCRVDGAKPATTRGAGERNGWGMQAQGRIEDDGLGRWPANVMHDGSEEVLAAFPTAPGALAPVRGDEPSASTSNTFGKFTRAASDRTGEASAERRYTERGGTDFALKPGQRRPPEASAARFFYCAKADRTDRNEGGANNTHPTVKPTDLMRYLCRLVTPPGGLVLDPFMGSGSTLKAAELEGFSAIGIELEPAYIDIARRRIAADAPLFAEVQA